MIHISSLCIKRCVVNGKVILFINEQCLCSLKHIYMSSFPGPEADVPVITKSAPADPVRPGDSVTLQCSVLSVSEETECPEGQKVFWFKAGSDRSPPHVIYVHGNRDGCEQSPEAPPPHRCVYSFSKNISSSDAGTYYCAAATCGQMLLGEGTTLETEGTDKSLIPILYHKVSARDARLHRVVIVFIQTLIICWSSFSPPHVGFAGDGSDRPVSSSGFLSACCRLPDVYYQEENLSMLQR